MLFKKEHEDSLLTYSVNCFLYLFVQVIQLFYSSLAFHSVSESVLEALLHPDWKKTMIEEMLVLEIETWDLVHLPTLKAIRCRWVQTVKLNLDGSLTYHKA